MSQNANKGKVAESLVKKFLGKNVQASMAWIRLPDAHAGSFQPTLADFLLLSKGKMILLEVKETAHDFRLPVGNFKMANRARLRVFELAGAKAFVLIYHSTTDRWRIAENAYFGLQDTGSWDLRDLPTFDTCADALKGCYDSRL